eukprot:NODE_137_length_18042_cov_0.768823.p3 type:complete len:785 gc:universal NODE_137_length_18042_cov_0.768823:8924-6570(-)
MKHESMFANLFIQSVNNENKAPKKKPKEIELIRNSSPPVFMPDSPVQDPEVMQGNAREGKEPQVWREVNTKKDSEQPLHLRENSLSNVISPQLQEYRKGSASTLSINSPIVPGHQNGGGNRSPLYSSLSSPLSYNITDLQSRPCTKPKTKNSRVQKRNSKLSKRLNEDEKGKQVNSFMLAGKHACNISTSIIPVPFNRLFDFASFSYSQSRVIPFLLRGNNILIQDESDTILMEVAIVGSIIKYPDSQIFCLQSNLRTCLKMQQHWSNKFRQIGINCTVMNTHEISASVVVCTPNQLSLLMTKQRVEISLLIVDHIGACLSHELEVLLVNVKSSINTRIVIFGANFSNIKEFAIWLGINEIVNTEGTNVKQMLESTLHQNFNEHLLHLIDRGKIETINSVIKWLKQSFLFSRLNNDMQKCECAHEFISSLVSNAMKSLEEHELVTGFKPTSLGQCFVLNGLTISDLRLLEQINNKTSLFEMLVIISKCKYDITFSDGDKAQLYNIKQQGCIQEWFSGNKPKSPIKDVHEKVMLLLLGTWTRQLNSIHFVNESRKVSVKAKSILQFVMRASINKNHPNAFYNSYSLLRYTNLQNCNEIYQIVQCHEMENAKQWRSRSSCQGQSINSETPACDIVDTLESWPRFTTTATCVNNNANFIIECTNKQSIQVNDLLSKKTFMVTFMCFNNTEIVYFKQVSIEELIQIGSISFKLNQDSGVLSYMLLFDDYLALDVLKQLSIVHQSDVLMNDTRGPGCKVDGDVANVYKSINITKKWYGLTMQWLNENVN